jgi:tetratricopeptide (TPR) repeat protein
MNTNKILRNSILVGLFILPFIPLIVSSSMFFPFITGKNFAFRIITEIVFALWIVLAVREPKYRPKKSWILWAFAAFVAIVAVADLLGANAYRSFWSNYERMEGLVTHLHLFALFVVMGSLISTEKLWKWFFHVSLGSAIFACLYSLVQISGKLAIDQSTARVDATFGNATYLAVYLLFHIFITLLYLFRPKNAASPILALGSLLVGHILAAGYMLSMIIRSNTPLGGVLGLICVSLLVNVVLYFVLRAKGGLLTALYYAEMLVFEVVVLYFTATRGAMLGLIGGLFLAALLYALRAENGMAKKAALGVIAAIFVFVGLFFVVRNADFVKNNPVMGRFASISLNDGTTQSRFIIWKNISWNGFKEHPILGWGQENFNLVFNKYYVPQLWPQEPWFDRSHNVFFDWLISAGILGLLAYLSLFAAAFYTIFKKKNNTLSLADKCVFTGLFAGYFAQNLTVFDNLTSYLMFFAVLAYLYSTQYAAALEPAHHEGSKNIHREQLIVALTIIGFVVVLYFVNIRGILESRALIRAISPGQSAVQKLVGFKEALSYNSFGNSEAREQLVTFASSIARSPDVDQNTRRDILTYAREEILKQVDQSPTDARYRFFAGSYFNRIQDPDEAVMELEKAVEYSPQKQMLLFELGAAYINKGLYPQALAVFKKAYDLDPTYDEAKTIYAIGAVYAGDDKLAEQLVGPNGFNDDRFVSAYAARGEYDKVISVWQKRVAADPNNASYHVSLAAAYLGGKQRDMAVKELQTAIKLNPQFKDQGEYYIKEIKAGRNP